MPLNNIMEKLIENQEQYPQLNHYWGQLKEEQQEYFLKKIQDIKKDQLYKSPIHGLYHSEKVALFAYLLACKHNLNQEDTQIIMDAAIYHDFKRANDFEDSFHGMVSADHIEEVVPLEAVYSIRVNLLLLKSIIDYHSQPDHKLKLNFELYDLEEKEWQRYHILAHMLKDADDLDRKRFGDKSQAALNKDLLRIEESKSMIDLATEINQAYYQILAQNQTKKIPLKQEIGDCFHSIGFDFFRLSSVLKNGILSYSEMAKLGLSFPRNFDGGNASRWISVVPVDCLKENETAFKTFIKNGITFMCDNQIFYKPVNYNNRSMAILDGLPFDKSGYSDERYVLEKIEPESILTIFVTKEHENKDVSELSYLYNSLHYESLENKVNYLLNQMGITSIKEVSSLLEPLSKYKQVLKEYEKIELVARNDLSKQLISTLNPILCEINSVIQKLIHNYYATLLNRSIEETVCVKDVLLYELAKTKTEVTMIDGMEELVLVISNSKTKKL